jgi:hypothetical protein
MKSGSAMKLASFLLCLITFNLPSQARADSQWDALQIMCLPDLDYFSLRTMTLEDIKPKDAESTKRLQTQDGIYEPKQLLNTPYKCDLPGHSVSAEIVDYVAPHYPGECGLNERFDILLKVDGTEVDKFHAYGLNRCTAPETHLIEVDLYHFRNCTISYSAEPDGQKTCKQSKL